MFFAVTSFFYRMFITLAIALFIATQYFFVGVVLALWAVASGMLMPIVMLVNNLAFGPRLRNRRLRAVLASATLAAGLGLLLFAVPVPSWTNAQGVIWGAEQSSVRGGADGFVMRVLAAPGARVQRGTPLLEAADPLLVPRIRSLEAQRDELEARYYAERVDSLVRAQMRLEKPEERAKPSSQRARERARDLVVRSPTDGLFAVAAAEDLPGRFLKQGELVGYVVPEGRPTARVLVPQDAVDLVRGRTVQRHGEARRAPRRNRAGAHSA